MNARVALVGQGPGEMEAYQGRPFVGPSGERLDGWLVKAELRRREVWVDNSVRCWLPKNRQPTRAEQSHCWEAHVGPSLHALTALRVVAPIGIPAFKLFLGTNTGERDAGQIFQRELPTCLKP